MENQTISINLQTKLYVLSGNTPIAAYLRNKKALFIKEGWPKDVFFKEFPDFDHYVDTITVVGHFSVAAWDFSSDSDKELNDFITA